MTTNASYLEVLAAKTRNGRTHWTRIGTAFATKDGHGYRLKLDFLPLHEETEIALLPPKPKVTSEAEGH